MAKRKKQRRQYQRPQGQPPQRRREREAPAPAAEAGWSTGRKVAVAAAAIAAGIGIFVAVVLTHGSNEPTAASPPTTTAAATTTPTGTSPQELAKRFGPLTGKRLFAVYCGICHTLADAGAQGDEGPDLDLLQPSKARVLRAIRRGGRGSGIMPANIFRGARAARVAAYVARATHARG